MTPRNPSLAHILTRRLAWLALAVVVVNALAVAAYYGSDSQALETEVIERQMDRLEAALEGESPRIDRRGRALFEDHPDSYAFALLDEQGRILDAENRSLIPNPATETGVFAQDWVTRLMTDQGRLLVAAQYCAGGRKAPCG